MNPEVLDQLSLINVAHNIHYKFEQGPIPPEQLRVYTQRLLRLLGYPTDDITIRAALETWQRIYPDDSRSLQSPSDMAGNAVPQLQAPATEPGDSYLQRPAKVGVFPPPMKPPSPDDEWGGQYWHVQGPIEYPKPGTRVQDAATELIRGQGFGMMDAIEWLKEHLSPDGTTVAKLERENTIPTQVNNPDDHWPDWGERNEDEVQHRELVYDHDQVWNRSGAISAALSNDEHLHEWKFPAA